MLLSQLKNGDFGVEITAFGFFWFAFRNLLRVDKSVDSCSLGFVGKGGRDEYGGNEGGGGGFSPGKTSSFKSRKKPSCGKSSCGNSSPNGRTFFKILV